MCDFSARRSVLSGDEENFCRQVTDAIPYWGRYPIPLEQNRLMPSVAVSALSRQTFLDLFGLVLRQVTSDFKKSTNYSANL